ncbi:MAG: DJ-1/PfpI family protein [Solirubrobacteraceae bacterium]
MDIAIPIYEDFTALDAVGPYEVLSRVPGARVRFIAAQSGPVRTDNGMLSLVAEASLDDVPAPDILVVPGGISASRIARDPAHLDWVRRAHETSTWTTSVCSGALLLGAAGILDGLRATTHWLDYDELASYGACVCADRVVEQGKVITSAGVSSGIDMALTLAARIAGDDVARGIQLGIEYDPQPPFDAGSVAKAGPRIEGLVRAAVAARGEAAQARLV